MLKGICYIVFILSLVLHMGYSFAAEIYLETFKGEVRRIPIALVVSGDNLSIMPIVNAVLKSDLDRSAYFDLMRINDIHIQDVPSRLDEVTRNRLTSMGVDAIIVAHLTQEGKKIILDGKLYETGSGELIYAKRYLGNDNLIRRIVHRFSDEIVFRLTGEQGIAQTRIVYISDQTGYKELYIMDYDGHSPKMITGNRSLNLSPAWSPDGSMISYTSYRGGNPDIYIVDLTTSKRWRLTDYPGLDMSPSWSPEGSVIAFASSRDGNAEIYTMNKEGQGLKRLTYKRGEDISPTWSPTGEEMAFTSDRGGVPQIYIMKADGTNLRRLTFKGEYNSDPVWSPKGDQIAFACRRGNGFRICSINPDGSGLREITYGPGSDESPAWALDGKRLVFASSRDGKWNIYTVNVGGGNPMKLTGTGANNRGANNWGPDWSPN